MCNSITRRMMIRRSLGLAAFPALVNPADVFTGKPRYQMGICDWSLEKASDPGSFALAGMLGLDGVMVDMGNEKQGIHLRQPSVQDTFMKAAKVAKVQISSLALGVFNQVPYKSDTRTQEWAWQTVDAAKRMHVPVILFAFFSNNDLRNDMQGQFETIQKLRELAPHAEKNGVTIGLETYLDAAGHQRIIDAVGSPAVKVYYDFRNTADAGHDPIAEFRKLGADLVCELHMKENTHLLGKGGIDWPGVRKALEETGFRKKSWMQIEWSYPDNQRLLEYHRENRAYLNSIFS